MDNTDEADCKMSDLKNVDQESVARVKAEPEEEETIKVWHSLSYLYHSL